MANSNDNNVAKVANAVRVTEDDVSWTFPSYILHNESMRIMETKILEERDRRYAEVNVEKEKALKIKETADLAALSLARESQVYKDQQADVMREKSLAASGVYATNADVQAMGAKFEESLKPLFEFINAQKGGKQGSVETTGKVAAFATIAISVVAIVVTVIIKFA